MEKAAGLRRAQPAPGPAHMRKRDKYARKYGTKWGYNSGLDRATGGHSPRPAPDSRKRDITESYRGQKKVVETSGVG